MNETLDINGQVYETDGIERVASEAIAVATEWVARGRGVYLESMGRAALPPATAPRTFIGDGDSDGVFIFLVWLATGQERYQ